MERLANLELSGHMQCSQTEGFLVENAVLKIPSGKFVSHDMEVLSIEYVVILKR